MNDNGNSYTCSSCNGVFEKGWTDEEASAESIEHFGVPSDTPGMEVVCDDCFKKIMDYNDHPIGERRDLA